MSLLQARRLNYRIGLRTVLNDISLHIHPGDNIALLGANGAGKSTLLKLLLGLLKPTSGCVAIDDLPLAQLSRRHIARHLAYVPQSHVPSFPYTVEQIVSQGRLPTTGLLRAADSVDKASVQQALQDLDITHLQVRLYTELSGGERQRVLIARALVQQARVIILDEPLTGVDYGQQARLATLLQRLADQGLAVLCSSHHPEQALACANRVLVLDGGQLIADGAPHAVIDSALMQRLYQVRVRQIDAHGQRFFIPFT
jgi:iron complex transport system ATP-binding protein